MSRERFRSGDLPEVCVATDRPVGWTGRGPVRLDTGLNLDPSAVRGLLLPDCQLVRDGTRRGQARGRPRDRPALPRATSPKLGTLELISDAHSNRGFARIVTDVRAPHNAHVDSRDMACIGGSDLSRPPIANRSAQDVGTVARPWRNTPDRCATGADSNSISTPVKTSPAVASADTSTTSTCVCSSSPRTLRQTPGEPSVALVGAYRGQVIAVESVAGMRRGRSRTGYYPRSKVPLGAFRTLDAPERDGHGVGWRSTRRREPSWR